MNTLIDIYAVISGKEFSIPMWEMVVFVLFVSFCLLFARYRLGLLTTYCFVFYWGFLSNLEQFGDILGNPTWSMSLYIFSGFLMCVVVIAGFMVQGRD